jgi:hypothetical protein
MGLAIEREHFDLSTTCASSGALTRVCSPWSGWFGAPDLAPARSPSGPSWSCS